MSRQGNSTHIRVHQNELLKLKDYSRELSYIQKDQVPIPEVIRRAFNIPRLKDILVDDAQMKAKVRK